MSSASNFGFIPRFLFDAKAPPPCSRENPDIFFTKDFFDEPDSFKTTDSFYENESAAKEVCSKCPLKFDCFLFAFESNQRGIWGGTTEKERTNIKRGRAVKVRRSLGLPPATRKSSKQH